MDRKNLINKISNVYTILGVSLIAVAMILIFIPTVPYIWYTLNPEATENEVEKLSAEIFESAVSIEIEKKETNLPPKDDSLPKGNFLIIESIGVNSPIGTDSDYTSVLKEGAWLAIDYGTPMENTFSIIIAAHRFGYAFWDAETRSEVSFFNLPKTEKGDEIKIIWDQREFTYEIYEEAESAYITDYDADLILYTCKYFNSPIRIFRYAKATY